MTREALAQEWRERLEDFAEAEMTVQQWCDFNRISIHSYYYWRRRLNADKTDKATTPHFLAVNVVDTPPVSPAGLTLRIAGVAIEVTAGFDPGLLRAVVGALANTPC